MQQADSTALFNDCFVQEKMASSKGLKREYQTFLEFYSDIRDSVCEEDLKQVIEKMAMDVTLGGSSTEDGGKDAILHEVGSNIERDPEIFYTLVRALRETDEKLVPLAERLKGGLQTERVDGISLSSYPPPGEPDATRKYALEPMDVLPSREPPSGPRSAFTKLQDSRSELPGPYLGNNHPSPLSATTSSPSHGDNPELTELSQTLEKVKSDMQKEIDSLTDELSQCNMKNKQLDKYRILYEQSEKDKQELEATIMKLETQKSEAEDKARVLEEALSYSRKGLKIPHQTHLSLVKYGVIQGT